MSMTKLMYLIQWDDPLFSCSFTAQKWLLFKNLMWWSKMDNIFRIYRIELTKITLSGPSIFWKSQICWPGRSGRFMNYIWNSNRYFRKTFVSSKMKPFLGVSVTLLVSSPEVPSWGIRSRALQGSFCGVRYCRLPS